MKTENPVPKIERERERERKPSHVGKCDQQRRPQNGVFKETNLGIGASAKGRGGPRVRGEMRNSCFRENENEMKSERDGE